MEADLSEKRSFQPIADSSTRILILGSLPGEVSLLRAQYYANPRNQFWGLIGAVIEQAMPTPYDERLGRLRAAGIGLWDVVRSARRQGSLDAAIQRHTANPLLELAQRLPSLQVIAFNGQKASTIGRAELGDGWPHDRLLDLPSSSPAHTLAFDRKRDAWLKLRQYLAR
jgi:hypoxanthine-DNA glycosylase